MSTRQSPNKWSLSLELPQLVILVGLVTGCLCAAYYLGFFSGQSSGFEMARASTASNVAKLPVVSAAPSENKHEEVASDVYAKLNTDKVIAAAKSDGPAQKNAEPELSVIRKADVAEETRHESASPHEESKHLDADVPVLSMEKEALKEKTTENTAVVRELKGSKTKDSTAPATLGDLLQQREDDLEKTGALKQPKATAVPEVAPIIAASRNPVPEIESSKPTHEEAPPVATIKPTPEKSASQKLAFKSNDDAKTETASVKKPEPKATATPEPKKKEAAGLPKGWFAQVAAPRTKADADALTKKLRGAGFAVVVEDAEVRGQTYFRLLVGPESSRETTERLVNQLRREKYLSSEPFIRMVK